MALAACAVMVSCEKEETTTKTNRLATPQVTATVGETEVSVSWEAIENAVSYEYTVDAGAAQSITTTSFTIAVADLAEGSHTVSVVALPEEGSEYKESRPGSATFEILGEPTEMPQEYAPYVGTWAVSSSDKINWVENPDDNRYVMAQLTESPINFNVTIAWDGINEVLTMTGWSPMEAYFGALPTILDFYEGDMCILTNVMLMEDMSEISSELAGFSMMVVGLADLGEEYGISSLTAEGLVPTYVLSIDGDGMTGTGITTTVTVRKEDGSTENVEADFVACDVTASSAQGNMVLAGSDDNIPAGTFIFTKTSSAVSINSSISIISAELNKNMAAAMTVSPMFAR